MPAQAIAPHVVPLPEPRNPQAKAPIRPRGRRPGEGGISPSGVAGARPRTESREHRMVRVPSDLVIVANRLPVDRVALPDGTREWRGSPGGLVTAIEPVMRANNGVWIGWPGGTDTDLEP